MKKMQKETGNLKQCFPNRKIKVMSYLKDGQLLKYILETYCHVKYFTDDWESVRKFLSHPNFPDRNREFKKQLGQAITDHTLSTKEFEKLTGEEFETQKELNEFLKTEVWKPLYGDEPIEM